MVVAIYINTGVKKVFPQAYTKKISIVDGGEDTVEVLIYHAGGIFQRSRW
jgi:glycerate kinase